MERDSHHSALLVTSTRPVVSLCKGQHYTPGHPRAMTFNNPALLPTNRDCRSGRLSRLAGVEQGQTSHAVLHGARRSCVFLALLHPQAERWPFPCPAPGCGPAFPPAFRRCYLFGMPRLLSDRSDRLAFLFQEQIRRLAARLRQPPLVRERLPPSGLPFWPGHGGFQRC